MVGPVYFKAGADSVACRLVVKLVLTARSLVTPATGFSRDLCQKQLTTRVYLELKPKLRL